MDKEKQPAPAPQQPTPTPLTGVRKRQQIEMTNRRIFIWVAVASVVVSFSLIALQFLVKEFLFNQKIISAKNQTNNTLIKNIDTAEELKANVNKLLADENLGSVEGLDQNAETSNLSLVLDALPVDGDATGFANSLQAVVLQRSGVGIDELSTTNQAYDASGMTTDQTSLASSPQPLPFSVKFGGNFQQTSQTLSDLAKVIRPISVNKLEISASDSTLTLTLNGVTYFVPAKTVSITKEQLKP
ncbi:TPA: hypothetical protein DCF80_04100 [Candidatus Saccharibacteria bacterium]|nr:hypothetical protein [Candidatus Saccharibacteria bacterium]HRK41224.1 hypothetical protein [Candidatus Saccharibacteria bacterium]